MKYAVLRLSKKTNHSETFDLKFKLENNSFVSKWIDRILEAQQKQYPISEPWAIYHLNDDYNKESLKNKINELINSVNQHEKLFDVTLKDINDQDTLNKIHSIFEATHGKLDEWKTNKIFENKPDSFRKDLSTINQLVHFCESYQTNKVYPKIRIVWLDLPKTKTFTNEDYKLFTNKREFGTLTTIYTDVGKRIEELAEEEDNHHHNIVPNLHYSADCRVTLYTLTNEEVKLKEEKYKKYIEGNKDRLLKNGYTIDDPRLTTGHIILGKIESDLTEDDLLGKIKNYNNIQSFYLI